MLELKVYVCSSIVANDSFLKWSYLYFHQARTRVSVAPHSCRHKIFKSVFYVSSLLWVCSGISVWFYLHSLIINANKYFLYSNTRIFEYSSLANCLRLLTIFRLGHFFSCFQKSFYLWTMCIANSFSHSVVFLLTLLIISFYLQSFLIKHDFFTL